MKFRFNINEVTIRVSRYYLKRKLSLFKDYKNSYNIEGDSMGITTIGSGD